MLAGDGFPSSRVARFSRQADANCREAAGEFRHCDKKGSWQGTDREEFLPLPVCPALGDTAELTKAGKP